MTDTRESFYDLLGVARDASPDEIRRAFRQAARQWAPDLNPSPDAHERMIRLNDARECLLDAERRAAYDADLNGGASSSTPTSARVVPDQVDLGELWPSDSRLVEIEVYLDGPLPHEVDISPGGDGWEVLQAVQPSDHSGRFLLLEVLVSADARQDKAGMRAEVQIALDDVLTTCTITWRVAQPTPRYSPRTSTPPPASAAASPSAAHTAPRASTASTAPSSPTGPAPAPPKPATPPVPPPFPPAPAAAPRPPRPAPPRPAPLFSPITIPSPSSRVSAWREEFDVWTRWIRRASVCCWVGIVVFVNLRLVAFSYPQPPEAGVLAALSADLLLALLIAIYAVAFSLLRALVSRWLERKHRSS